MLECILRFYCYREIHLLRDFMIPTHVLMYIATLMALLVAPCYVWYSAKNAAVAAKNAAVAAKNAAVADDSLVSSSQKNQAADAYDDITASDSDPDNNWGTLMLVLMILLFTYPEFEH